MFTAIGRLGFHPLDPPRSPLRCPGSALAALIYMLVESAGVMTKEGPVIPTRYTHKQLSSMIGSNREAVTRAFADLQEGGP